LAKWLIDNNIKTLNVAGNRGSKLNKTQRSKIESTLIGALEYSKKSEKKQDVISVEKDYPQFKTTAVRPFTYNGVEF
jgi:hypothetical protein